MARILISGDALVVKSDLTLGQIKTLEKYRPKALSLFSEDGKEELFRVGSTTGVGSINSIGASFGSETKDAEHKACITMLIPSTVSDAKKYAEEKIGVAILNLNKIEQKFGAANDEIEAELASIRENISVQ